MAVKPGKSRSAAAAPAIVRVDVPIPVETEIRLHARARKLGIRKPDLCLRFIEYGLNRYPDDRGDSAGRDEGS
jgi:hypothetical protein